MKPIVFAVGCPDYGQAEAAIDGLMRSMGGAPAFAKPGEKIIIKANLLIGSPPDRAATVHPAVAAALGAKFRMAGALVSLADSPAAGLPHGEAELRRTYAECGMEAAAREAGIDLCLDVAYRAVSFPQGKLIRRFDLMSPLLDADGLVNLSKLKTHTYTGMTGAIKNMFGAVPGRAKTAFHATLADPDLFCGMLLDLAACLPARLCVMDAVIGMEGDGPNAGSPRTVGWLLASTDPLALDIVASEMMCVPPDKNRLLRETERRGLSPCRIEDVELAGASLDQLRQKGYTLPRTMALGGGWDRAAGMSPIQIALAPVIEFVLKRGVALRPVVKKAECVSCGVCLKACPARAIYFPRSRVPGARGRKSKAARIRQGACIRCYCCHELCAKRAIALRGGSLARILGL
jgi:uncharacterized protein (DUF362 family)/Pyruvate/2-oxoacid:ferredoxin oxidoreductase delta subunit